MLQNLLNYNETIAVIGKKAKIKYGIMAKHRY